MQKVLRMFYINNYFYNFLSKLLKGELFDENFVITNIYPSIETLSKEFLSINFAENYLIGAAGFSLCEQGNCSRLRTNNLSPQPVLLEYIVNEIDNL